MALQLSSGVTGSFYKLTMFCFVCLSLSILSYLKAPGSWQQRKVASKMQHHHSLSKSSQSSTTSSTSAASNISNASASSMPVASGAKPAQRKLLGPTYKSGLIPVSRLGGGSSASNLAPLSSEVKKQPVAATSKSAVKPETKPELLQRASFQRKTLAVHKGRVGAPASGPMKATAPMRATEPTLSKVAGPMKALPRSGLLQPRAGLHNTVKKQGAQMGSSPLMPVKPHQAVATSRGRFCLCTVRTWLSL